MDTSKAPFIDEITEDSAESPDDDQAENVDPSPEATAEENDKGNFDEVFKGFAMLEDRLSDGTCITKVNIDKWLEEANILDLEEITHADTALYYTKVAKAAPDVNKDDFERFLDVLAEEKGKNKEELKAKLGAVSKPVKEEPGIGEKIKDAAVEFWEHITCKDSDGASASKDSDK